MTARQAAEAVRFLQKLRVTIFAALEFDAEEEDDPHFVLPLQTLKKAIHQLEMLGDSGCLSRQAGRRKK